MQTALPVRLGWKEGLAGSTASWPRRAALVISANVLLAVCAHLSIPLVFTPVPITLQTFAVILMGIVLGPAPAFSAALLYLAEGAMGLPVFSPAGPGGIAQLVGPTGGFLVSYPLAAGTAGLVFWLLRKRSGFAAGMTAGIAAIATVFAIGALWLAALTHAGAGAILRLGVLPFLPGEVIKVIAAAAGGAGLRRIVRT